MWSNVLALTHGVHGSHEPCSSTLVDPNTDAVPKPIRAMKGASNPYFIRGDFIEHNPKVVEAFLRANADAQAWMRNPANFDDLVQLAAALVPLTGVPQADAIRRAWLKSALAGYDTTLDRQALDAIANFAVQTGLIAQAVDVARIIHARAP